MVINKKKKSLHLIVLALYIHGDSLEGESVHCEEYITQQM